MSTVRPNTLLARYAECIFWLARYVERAENLARILDVQETFSRDLSGGQTWLSIVQLYAVQDRFFERYQDASAANVIDFYVLDTSNPSSILSMVRASRENARALRPLISTEMWTHLNIFYNQLRATEATRMAPSELPRLCMMIKENCQTHTGITEGTFFRDQGWYFYQLGRSIERADQTTRILDIKYHLLLPRVEDVGTIVDINQWHALLRSLAGYHAYRRLHPSGMSVESIIGFLILNRQFPRSLTLCAESIANDLATLKERYGLDTASEAGSPVDQLRQFLAAQTAEEILASGLHEFLDRVQMELGQVTNDLATRFFGRN